MNRQLELKDIAGYLPYNLTAVCYTESSQSGTWYITGVDMSDNTVAIESQGIHSHDVFSRIKPILRPKSDLYHPITQKGYKNGEPFVPILEIANSCGKGVWERSRESGWIVNEENDTFIFDNGVFLITDGYHHSTVYNQHTLFDLLHLWKIDYRGLIEAGLAVSTESLKINPYENNQINCQ